jgi:spoIIIJ-associated protein
MSDECRRGEEFLNSIFDSSKLDIRAALAVSEEGCLLNLEGDDSPMLRSEGGELLHALEHLVNQVYGRSLSREQRFICDVGNFRAAREAELRAMANLAAERVRSSHVPFTFGPMVASERRVIHVTLADQEDLQTESVGEGNDRRLRIAIKSPAQK